MYNLDGSTEVLNREVNDVLKRSMASSSFNGTELEAHYQCSIVESPTMAMLTLCESLAIGAKGWRQKPNMEPLWFTRETRVSYQQLARSQSKTGFLQLRLYDIIVRRALHWATKCYRTLYMSKGGFTLTAK